MKYLAAGGLAVVWIGIVGFIAYEINLSVYLSSTYDPKYCDSQYVGSPQHGFCGEVSAGRISPTNAVQLNLFFLALLIYPFVLTMYVWENGKESKQQEQIA